MRIERLIEKAPILLDRYYQKCLELASKSQGDEVYGGLLVKNRKVLGEGRNRAVVHGYFKLKRKIIQGLSNHAEIEAMLDAIEKGEDVSGGNIYVAGFFNNRNELFLHNEYTCVRCTPHLEKYGIKNIYIPTPEGWVKRPFKEAKEEAKLFKYGTHKNRVKGSLRGYKAKSLKELVEYFI